MEGSCILPYAFSKLSPFKTGQRLNALSGLSYLLFNSHFILRGTDKAFPCFEFTLWEILLVRRVGIILGFKTEGIVLVKGNTLLADVFGHHKVARVKLNTGKICVAVKRSSGHRLINMSKMTELADFTVDAEIMVIASALNKLFVLSTDVLTDCLCCSEVKCCALNASDFARGYAVCIRGCICDILLAGACPHITARTVS